jgi:hypothetical protein
MKERGHLVKPSYRSDDNIKMDVTEISLDSVKLIHMAQRMVQRRVLLNRAKNLWVSDKQIPAS